MLREIREDRVKALVDSATQFRVADLLDERWIHTLDLAVTYLRSIHVSMANAQLEIVLPDPHDKDNNVYRMASLLESPVWHAVLAAIGFQIVEENVCDAMLHNCRLLLRMHLTQLPRINDTSLVFNGAGEVYSTWVNLSSFLLSICGVKDGKEDLTPEQLEAKRKTFKSFKYSQKDVSSHEYPFDLTKIPWQLRERIWKTEDLSRQQRRQWAIAVWMGLEEDVTHSYFEIRSLLPL